MKYLEYILNTLLLGFFVAVGGLFLAATLPIPGQVELKIVKSGSMEPSIMTGGLVVIQPAETYRVGDVITFGADTKQHVPTTHRVISMSEEGGRTVYTTQGDANEEADPNPVYEQEVIGRVIFSMPYAGYILDFARQPFGFALLIAVPAAVVIMGELMALWREFRSGCRARHGYRTREPEPEAPSREPLFRPDEPASPPREASYRYAEPTVDLRQYRDPNVLNLRGIRPGAYQMYE